MGSLRKLANSWMLMRPPLQEQATAAKPSSSFFTLSHFRLRGTGEERRRAGHKDLLRGGRECRSVCVQLLPIADVAVGQIKQYCVRQCYFSVELASG